MLDLEHAIKEWRVQMAADGITNRDVLNELESHLRDQVDVLLLSGMPDGEAFQLAVSRLGSSALMRKEFNKIKRGEWLPVKIVATLSIGIMIVLGIVVAHELFAGKLTLLFVHVAILTSGYFLALLTGVLGICYIALGFFHNMSPGSVQSVRRAAFLLNCVTLGLLAIGCLLGMLWAQNAIGKFEGWDAREIAVFCVLAWWIGTVTVQRLCRISDRAVMLMCISGNLVVLLGWFGANIFATLHTYGTASHWLFELAIGIHVLFLLLGSVPVALRFSERART